MKKILILTDVQMDFVTGTMSVKKRGKEAVERTKIFINRNKEDIEKVIFKCILTSPYDEKFKRNGGEYPMYCVKWTPGACVEPTILKLLWRLQIPYEMCITWNNLDKTIKNCESKEIVVAGMNGNTTLKKVIDTYWNVLECKVFWPGTYFFQHDENLFRYLREHSEGIFEVPKRDKKKDLFVQRIKGMK